MVQIVNYRECNKDDGSKFYLLEIQGGVEMVKSKSTGQFYATAKKAYISSTFNETTCKGLIGTQMQGNIVKKEVASYTYIVKETGDEITLTHKWVFEPKSSNSIEKLFSEDIFTESDLHELEKELA